MSFFVKGYKLANYNASLANESVTYDSLATNIKNGLYPNVESIDLNWSAGYVNCWDGQVTSNSHAIHSQAIAVTAGDEYFVKSNNYYDGRQVVFMSNGKPLSFLPSNSDTNMHSFKFTIPKDTDHMYINSTPTIYGSLFRVISYYELPEYIDGLSVALKDKTYNWKNIALTQESKKGYWSPHSGLVVEETPTDKNAKVMYKPIKVMPYDIYQVHGGTDWDAVLYIIIDASGQVVDYYPKDQSVNSNLTITVTIPRNGAYLLINEYFANSSTTLRKATSIIETNKLTNKKWNAIGDSWTQIFSNSNESYTNDVAQITGINAKNFGIGGTGYFACNNDETERFDNRNIDNDADIYTVFGSFNDAFISNFKFGQKGDTGTDTMWGLMLKTVNHIYSINPNAMIGLITPGAWGAINPFSTSRMSTLVSHSDSSINNSAINEWAEKYVATIQEFGKLYSLPVLDLYHESNLRPWDSNFVNTWYHGENDTDDTHPNATTMKKIIAPKVANFLQSIIADY